MHQTLNELQHAFSLAVTYIEYIDNPRLEYYTLISCKTKPAYLRFAALYKCKRGFVLREFDRFRLLYWLIVLKFFVCVDYLGCYQNLI